jgi:crossover junction endodeoxyribonuclease RusA
MTALRADGLADLVIIDVYGQPAPQGSKSAFIRGGRAIVTEGGSKTGRSAHAAWRQAVATAARDWQQPRNRPLMDGALSVRIDFRLTRPKSVTVKARPHPVTKPDLDKLERAVLDSLTGIIFGDDSQVVELHTSKRYADGCAPGCQIRIETLP